MNDLSYAIRMLKKNPGFTLTAVLTMTLGIGLNSAVFSVVNAVLFKPLPVHAPEELVSLFTLKPGGFASHMPLAYPDFEDLREQSSSFSHLIAYSFTPLAMEHGGESVLLWGELATGNYFETLDIQPTAGRTFTQSDDQRGEARRVAVLSYLTWQRRFGGDPSIVGQTVRLNGQNFTISGVAPEGFNGLTRGLAPELWLPIQNMRTLRLAATLSMDDETPDGQANRLDDRGRRWHWAMARLKPGVSADQARTEVSALGARLAEAYPDSNEGRALTAVPANRVRILPGVDQALYAGSFVVMGLVALVLIIACANLANMLLARTLTRRKEIATRLALGASRGRVIRQLLVESLTLASVGGALGLGVAFASSSLLSSLRLPLPMQVALDLSVDLRVAFFTLAIATLTAVVFGLAPAREAARANLATALHEDGRGSHGGVPKRRMRSALVVAQVALSLLLLICAGLSVRSMRNAHHIDPGFNPTGVAVAKFAPQLQGYDVARAKEFYQRLSERLEAMPGVSRVGFATMLPLTLEIRTEDTAPAGQDTEDPNRWPDVDSSKVGPGYFEALGIEILRGRDFTDRDTADSPRVAVINETLAQRFWPDEDPLGKRLSVGKADGNYEVVGVVRAGKYRTLGEDSRPYLYRSLTQIFSNPRTLLVKSEGDARAILPLIRQASRELDEKIAISGLETLDQAMNSSLLLPRMGATLFGLFGVAGLLLATLGIYGVMAYTVNQRTHEIGIRMAMGARRLDVLRLVVRQGVWLTGLGLAFGLAGAAAVTRSLSAVLYGISATDAVTFVVVPLFLALVALAASYIPARRASQVNPIVALRSE